MKIVRKLAIATAVVATAGIATLGFTAPTSTHADFTWGQGVVADGTNS